MSAYGGLDLLEELGSGDDIPLGLAHFGNPKPVPHQLTFSILLTSNLQFLGNSMQFFSDYHTGTDTSLFFKASFSYLHDIRP